MAADGETQLPDMNVHEKTYGKVIGMLKWGGVAVAIIALAVIFLISR